MINTKKILLFIHSERALSIIFTHSEWVIMNLRSEGVIDSLILITYLPLRIAKGEMDGNNVVTYMMQESYYNDCVTFVMWLYDTYHTVGWQMPYNHMTYTNV